MPEHAAARASSPYYTPEHEAFRETVRRFVAKEIEPFATQWDEAGEFPRELYKKAAALGVLQLGFPEEYGGIECDRFYRLIWAQELARAGAGGISASLNSHTIGAPPIARFGSDAMKRRVLPPILAGEKIWRSPSPSPAQAPTSPPSRPRRAATAITTWCAARRRSSPPACAPISIPWRCGPAGPAWAASRCC